MREAWAFVMGIRAPSGRTGVRFADGALMAARGAGKLPDKVRVGGTAAGGDSGRLPVVAQPASQTAIAISQAEAIFIRRGRDDSG